MRLKKDRRIATAALIALLLFSCGCNKKPNGNSSPVSSSTSNGAASSGPTSREAAEAFLQSLKDGKATPEQLTVAFRASIAPPKIDGDKKAGYSASEARDWLTRFQGTNFVVGEEANLGDGIVLRGRAESPNRREAFSLRMVKNGSNFKVDWLHRSERMGTDIKSPADADLLGAQDAVRNFLDVLLGGDLRLAHALMSSAWKKSLAPATPGDVRDGFDYSPGFLTQTTRSWKIGEYLGYKLPKAELAADKFAATFTAELDAGATKTPYTVLTVKDKTSGQWLIESFSKQ
jgi:hypothetical protein